MTPSAARGVLDAILWKPAIRWRVERIHVLAPIRFEAIRRNEVNSKASLKSDIGRYFADEDRAQRNTLMLRNVDYVIEAHFTMTDLAGSADSVRKFVEMFVRRLQNGQCFHTPYLGCREFAADFGPAPATWAIPPDLEGTRDLGHVLLDLHYVPKRSPTPVFFPASLRGGVLEVPEVPR
jgi:CRISPR-associated protein Cas5d